MVEEEEETIHKMESYVHHKDHTILSIPSFSFDSTDYEQDTKLPTTRDQEILTQEILIQHME